MHMQQAHRRTWMRPLDTPRPMEPAEPDSVPALDATVDLP